MHLKKFVYEILWFRSCLDPAYYMTLPNFAWDAMLKKTNITLGLVHDQDMYEMIEKGKRGGVCQVSSKYGKAYNNYMKPYSHILFQVI